MTKQVVEKGHRAGCQCGFCKNKGSFGKKKAEEPKNEKKPTAESVIRARKIVSSLLEDDIPGGKARTTTVGVISTGSN